MDAIAAGPLGSFDEEPKAKAAALAFLYMYLALGHSKRYVHILHPSLF
jgi:type VI protein secretion system component VasF